MQFFNICPRCSIRSIEEIECCLKCIFMLGKDNLFNKDGSYDENGRSYYYFETDNYAIFVYYNDGYSEIENKKDYHNFDTYPIKINKILSTKTTEDDLNKILILQ